MRLVLLSIGLFFVSIIHAQESSGLIFGNHNGLLSSQINPSYVLRSENKWDLQLIGGHMFFQTNYAFVNNSSLIKVLNNTSNIELAQNDTPIDQYELPLVFRQGESGYKLESSAELFAPGFLYRLDEQTALGFSVKGRAMASTGSLPIVLEQRNLESLPVDSSFSISPFSANSAAWIEYSLHGAKDLGNGNSLGVNLKYLKNKHSAFIDNNLSSDISRSTDNIINALSTGQIEFGGLSNQDVIGSFGSGFSLDLGITLENLFPFTADVGISILDLGYLKNNSSQYQISYDDLQNIDPSDYESISNTEQLMDQLESDFIQLDSSAGFVTYLPTALSFQLIRPITEKLSIEASLTQRISFSDRQLKRPNSLTASLVYERKNFSAFVPITVYDYSSIRVGAAIRLWYLTIGTDHLTSVVSNQDDFDGTDVYVNLKFYPFSKRHSKGDQVLCPF